MAKKHFNISERHIAQQLNYLKNTGQYRVIPEPCHQVISQQASPNPTLLNLSSNDYLGLSLDTTLQQVFINQYSEYPKFGSTSSRLLTGNDEQAILLEQELQQWYQNACQQNQNINIHSNTYGNAHHTNQKQPIDGDVYNNHDKTALLFNSGYHANLGILPALTKLPIKTVILADKLVHASMIDGLKLSSCDFFRYRHNDMNHLQSLITNLPDDIQRIIIVTESVFSMDGDVADLVYLTKLKKEDNRIELYVDEAHAIGVFGKTGLGLAEATGTLQDIDYLIGTFGKAFASMGAYILCSPLTKEWLINHMRPLIYSTSLPPITHAWTRFILNKMPNFQQKRQHVLTLAKELKSAIETLTQKPNPSLSPIVPYILGDNAKTIQKTEHLQSMGFYVLPIRPPTVPQNTARIRFVMNASLTNEQCHQLICQL